MSDTSSRRIRSDFEKFVAWMFCFGLFCGLAIGYAIALVIA